MLIVLLLLSNIVHVQEGKPLKFCFESCRLVNQVVTCDVLLDRDLEKLSRCVIKHSGVVIIDIRRHELTCNCGFLEFCLTIRKRPWTILYHDSICNNKQIVSCGRLPQSASFSGEEPVFAVYNGMVFDLTGEDFETRLTDMYAEHKNIITSLTNPIAREKYMDVEEETIEKAVLAVDNILDSPDSESVQEEGTAEEAGNTKGFSDSDQEENGEETEHEDEEEDSEDYELPEEDKENLLFLMLILVICHFVLITIVIIILVKKVNKQKNLVMKSWVNQFSPRKIFKHIYNINASALIRKRKKNITNAKTGEAYFFSKNDNNSDYQPKDHGKNWEIIKDRDVSYPMLYDQNDQEAEISPQKDVTLDFSKVPYEIMVNEILRGLSNDDPLMVNIETLFNKVQMFKKELQKKHLLEMDTETSKQPDNFTNVHDVKNNDIVMHSSRKSSRKLRKK